MSKKTAYTLIDGKKAASAIKEEIALQVRKRKRAKKKIPHLTIIMVGDDPASDTYVKGKIKACKAVGFNYSLMRFADTISESRLLKHIHQINTDSDVDGFIVQLPLPPHIDVEKITEHILPEKDVDGFTNQNFGSIAAERPLMLPATPYGIMELLRRHKIATRGRHCVVIGASRLVGAPLSMMLTKHGRATVTVCHKYTRSLPSYTRMADILIVAVGKPGMIGADMVKKGAVVIDVGTTRIKDSSKASGFTLKGDVDFEAVAPQCSHITPVPGGVGPMTVASLLLNTLKATEKRILPHDDEQHDG